jgi:hypothetical protein
MKVRELINKKIQINLDNFEIDSEDLIHHINRYSSVNDDYDIDDESLKTYITERYFDLIIDDIVNSLRLTIKNK